jgi:predicted ABC-type sugar transport system permease subunit
MPNAPFWGKSLMSDKARAGIGCCQGGGSIAGPMMIGLINNGLILMGLEFSQQLVARGMIIILAVNGARSRP